MKSYIINQEKGITLEKFISLKINVNKTFLLLMKRKKLVKVNNKHPNDYKIILNENDVINIYLSDEMFKEEIINIPFSVIYEDNNLLVVDKKKGVLVHSASKDNHNNLLDQVIKYLINKGEYIPSREKEFKPALINRIDTNTVGLVLFAKNKETLNIIKDLMEKNEIKKEYLGIFLNKFIKKEDVLKDYYSFDEKNNKAIISHNKLDGFKEIITKYKVLEEKNNLSLVLVELLTGRTHQIRAHLSFYNHPILGDKKYGGIDKKNEYNSQELVSFRLSFLSDNLKHLNYLKNKTFISNFMPKLFEK